MRTLETKLPGYYTSKPAFVLLIVLLLLLETVIFRVDVIPSGTCVNVSSFCGLENTFHKFWAIEVCDTNIFSVGRSYYGSFSVLNPPVKLKKH